MNLLKLICTGLLGLAIFTAANAQSNALFADGFETPQPLVSGGGGANYHWFGDDGLCQADSRENYGLLKRYQEVDAVLGPVRAVAQQQLAAMRASGMRRLSLGVYFMHQPSAGGTLIDSSDPVQVAQAASNLALLLADVKAAGYQSVLFRFFPTANINPSQSEFPGTSSADYGPRVDEYWNLIQALRPVLAASGISYRIDLMVEGAPRDSNNTLYPENQRYKYPANTRWSRTVRTLWQRYVAQYGRGDTVGFSFLPDQDSNRLRSRVRHMRYVYEDVYPQVFAMDFYAGTAWDEYDKFLKMDEHMRGQNPPGASWDSTGWIIAEAYYEDPLSADALARAIRATGRTVYYLTQWPLDRAGACQAPHVNVAPPYDWMIWRAYGF